MNFVVGGTVAFVYNNKPRMVKIEKVGKTYIQGRVINENDTPKSFTLSKIVAL